MLAPLIVSVFRFAEGTGLSVDYGGAALLATRNMPSGKRSIYGAFPPPGAPIGFIIANLLFRLLNLTLPADTLAAWAGASRSSPGPYSSSSGCS